MDVGVALMILTVPRIMCDGSTCDGRENPGCSQHGPKLDMR